MTHKYQGRYFSILGDSISTLDGYNPSDCGVFYDRAHQLLAGIYSVADTWWGQVIESLGGKLLVNNAWSGSMVCKHPACQIPSYGCSDERTGALGLGPVKPDVVMVLMGLNDFGCGMAVTGGEELQVFSAAYETMLGKLRSYYPEAEIWCLTLPCGTWRQEAGFSPIVERGGWHIGQYCQAIAACAETWNCRLVDIYDLEKPYDTIDGYHPTAEGMQTIAQAVLKALEAEKKK